MLRTAPLVIAFFVSLAAPVLAQTTSASAGAAQLPAQFQQTAGGLPIWAWVAIAVVVVLLLVGITASRRKRRQAIIKTRIG